MRGLLPALREFSFLSEHPYSILSSSSPLPPPLISCPSIEPLPLPPSVPPALAPVAPFPFVPPTEILCEVATSSNPRRLAALSTFVKSSRGLCAVSTLLDSGAEPDAVAPEALVRQWFPNIIIKPCGFVAGALGEPVPSLVTDTAVEMFFSQACPFGRVLGR